MKNKARLWDAACVLLIAHTYCAMHGDHWPPAVEIPVLGVMVVATAAVIVHLIT